VVSVALNDAKTGASETLTCTPEHPFFVPGQGWVEAGSLGIGTSIVTRAGPQMAVASVTWQKNKAEELASTSGLGGYTVYNLTVDGDHTFFVGTTGGGTWVHNIRCFRGVPRDNPHYPDVLAGNQFPRGGPATAEEHSMGDTNSPFTSWNTDPNIAAEKALDPTLGGRGVILQKDIPESALQHISPKMEAQMGEKEVLARGPVTGASVTWVP